MKILIANPNMSRTMVDLMVAEARQSCRPGTEVEGVAADFGVPYIATRSEMAIAGHALLDSLARHHQGYDAVIVGAFIQSIVAGAKELMPIPVIGLAEASLRAAQILGRRVSILGVGTPGRGANQDIISELRMDRDVVSVRPLPLSGTALATDQARADQVVIELGLAAVAEDNADVLVLGGAAFAGMAKRIAGQLSRPLRDWPGGTHGIVQLAQTQRRHLQPAGRKTHRGSFPGAVGLLQAQGLGAAILHVYRPAGSGSPLNAGPPARDSGDTAATRAPSAASSGALSIPPIVRAVEPSRSALFWVCSTPNSGRHSAGPQTVRFDPLAEVVPGFRKRFSHRRSGAEIARATPEGAAKHVAERA
jgi:Asp/Glu/hydantoin racemase